MSRSIEAVILAAKTGDFRRRIRGGIRGRRRHRASVDPHSARRCDCASCAASKGDTKLAHDLDHRRPLLAGRETGSPELVDTFAKLRWEREGVDR